MNKRGKAGRIMGQLSVVDAKGAEHSINDQLINLGFAERFGE